MVVYYNGNEDALRCVLRWHATLTKEVFLRYEIWLILGIGITLTILLDLEVIHLPQGMLEIEIKPLMGPVLSVATFSAVFYNSQCFSRYMFLYNGCMKVDSAAKVFVTELVADFGHAPELRGHVLAAAKYMLAAVFYFYSSMDDRDMAGDHWDWFGTESKALLTSEEIQFVQGFPGHKLLLLLHWAQIVVSDGVRHEATARRFSPPEKSGITNRLFAQIDAMAEQSRLVSNTLNLPVPFPYFHLLNLLIFFSLLVAGLCCCIFAAQVKNITYCVAILPLAVVAFVLIGIRTLASQLSDPFGTDDVDFPHCDFMRQLYDHVASVLQASLRFCPIKDKQIANTQEFTVEQILTPCKYTLEEMPPDGIERSKSLVARLRMSFHGSDNLMHGPRIWIHPEDWSSAQRFGNWVASGRRDEEFSNQALDGVPEEKAKGPIEPSPKVEQKLVPAPAAPQPTAGATDQQFVDGLAKMNDLLAKVVGVVERLPAEINKAAGNGPLVSNVPQSILAGKSATSKKTQKVVATEDEAEIIEVRVGKEKKVDRVTSDKEKKVKKSPKKKESADPAT